jgi:PAS domain S-box-containing protein
VAPKSGKAEKLGGADADSFLSAAFEHAPLEFWVRDAEGRCIVQNAAGRRWGDLVGALPEESSVTPQMLAAWQENNRRAYAGEIVRNEIEYDLGGEKRHYQCVVAPIRNERGEITGILGFNVDITDLRESERRSERSEASLRVLLESIPDGVIVQRDGLIDYLNPAARTMLGFALDEDVRGKPVTDILHPDRHAAFHARTKDIMAQEKVPVAETRLVRKDGTIVVVEVAAHLAVLDGKPSVLAIARDVTARKDLEAQVILADRLASLGRLSASIGHELNNPLGWVLGNTELMQRELARDDVPPAIAERLATHVQMVKEGATHMRDIVHDLKMLARGEREQSSLTDVTHVLDVCVNMAGKELRERARIVREYGEQCFVHSTEARLGQVFLNLLLNAAEAIPRGDAEHHEVRIIVRTTDAQFVEVQISDTGAGLAPEIRERIFEPFFTTKEGGGTGLGLAITHRIVTSAGGSITVDSRPGGGSIFRVKLPAAVAR